MIEFASPCQSSRNFLMSHVEIVHPQQPLDISSMKESENDFDKQFKQQKVNNPLERKVRKKQTFFSLIKIQHLVSRFVQNLRYNTYLRKTLPKSLFVDYLLHTTHKGNYPIHQKSAAHVQFRRITTVIWEKIIYLTNLLLILILPLGQIDGRIYLLIIFQSIFIIDMGVSLLRPYYREGKLIRDRYQIIKNYLNGVFMQDFFKLVLILAIILDNSNYKLELQFFVDLSIYAISLPPLHAKFLSNNYFAVKFVELIFMVIFTCHLFTNEMLQLESQDQSYITRFIKIFGIFLGEADFDQKDVSPIIYLTIECLFLFLRGYILIQIISFCLFNQERKNKKKELFDLYKYLRKLHVSRLISNRVVSYYKTIIMQDQSIKLQNFDILFTQTLKPKLAEELKLQIQGNFLKTFKVFNKFTVQTVKKLVCSMESADFKPNQQVYSQSGEDDQSIYFIQEGKVMITFGDNELYIKSEASSFGEIAFFTGLSRHSTAVSLGYSKLYKIQRQVYLNAVSTISQDLETAQMIKDKIIHLQQYDVIQRKCECCAMLISSLYSKQRLNLKQTSLSYRNGEIALQEYYNIKDNRKRLRYQDVLLNSQFYRSQALEFQENNDLANIEEQTQQFLENELSFSSEQRTKSFQSPDPLLFQIFNQKKMSGEPDDALKKSKQQYIQPILESSQEVQSISSSQESFQCADFRYEEPCLRMIQEQLIKPKFNKGDECFSPSTILKKARIVTRQRSQSQNVMDLSQIPNIQSSSNKKILPRSLSQISYEDKITQNLQNRMKTNTSQFNAQSLIQVFQNENNPVYMEFIQIDLDRGYNFSTYLPNNNMDVVIKQIKPSFQQRKSKYTLNYELSKQLKRIVMSQYFINNLDQ